MTRVLKFNEFISEGMKSRTKETKSQSGKDDAEKKKEIETISSSVKVLYEFFNDEECFDKNEKTDIMKNVELGVSFYDNKKNKVISYDHCTFEEMAKSTDKAKEFIEFYVNKSTVKDFAGKSAKDTMVRFGFLVDTKSETCQKFVDNIKEELKSHPFALNIDEKVEKVEVVKDLGKLDAPGLPSKLKPSVALWINKYDEFEKLINED